MFGASGKLPEGRLSSGNNAAPGLFEECLAAKGPAVGSSFQGQYCTVFFSVENVEPDELAEQQQESSKIESRNWLVIHQISQFSFNGPKLKKPKEKNGNTQSAFAYLPNIGFCIPSSCSALDFRSAVAQLVGHSASANATAVDDVEPRYKSVVSITDEDYCFTQKKIDSPPKFDGPDIAVMYSKKFKILFKLGG